MLCCTATRRFAPLAAKAVDKGAAIGLASGPNAGSGFAADPMQSLTSPPMSNISRGRVKPGQPLRFVSFAPTHSSLFSDSRFRYKHDRERHNKQQHVGVVASHSVSPGQLVPRLSSRSHVVPVGAARRLVNALFPNLLTIHTSINANVSINFRRVRPICISFKPFVAQRLPVSTQPQTTHIGGRTLSIDSVASTLYRSVIYAPSFYAPYQQSPIESAF